MLTMQHYCSALINIEPYQSHGETILYLEDPQTRQQIDRCPECKEVITEKSLFPLDIFPNLAWEMAEFVTQEA